MMSSSARITGSAPSARPDSGPAANSGEWAQAAEKGREAVEAAGAMAGHAGQAMGNMASDAASDVGRRADSLASDAGAGIRELGDRLSKGGPQAGMLGSASQALGQTVQDGGEYLENAKLSGMSRDLAQVVRQNPLPAVGIAFGLGWLLSGRMRN
jgi:hypothetical protein